MSVRSGLLALLVEQPQYGAQLRAEFEERTGGTWPLNVGQVYTTVGRLERDGLVEQVGEPDAEGRIRYGLTDVGREAVRQWWGSPVERTEARRDELAIKLALAVTTPGVDVRSVVQTQRTATVRHLRDLTKLKKQLTVETGAERDLAWLLVLESLVFGTEAEVRWLDHVESMLARYSTRSAAVEAKTASDRSAGQDGVELDRPVAHREPLGGSR